MTMQKHRAGEILSNIELQRELHNTTFKFFGSEHTVKSFKKIEDHKEPKLQIETNLKTLSFKLSSSISFFSKEEHESEEQKEIFDYEEAERLKRYFFTLSEEDKKLGVKTARSYFQNGVIASNILGFYDLKTESFGIVNNRDKHNRIEYLKKESMKLFCEDHIKFYNNIYLERLPKVKTVFEPNMPFGIIPNSKMESGFTKLNLHNEPSFNPKVSPKVNEHIENLLLNLFENQEGVEYALNWLANLVQRNKNETTIILSGKEGAGKGTLMGLLGKIIGEDNSIELGNSSLDSSWNDDMVNRRLIGFNEINDFSRNQSVANKVKAYTTDYMLPIYARFQSAYKYKNVGNYLIFSNSDNILRISFTDRRFSVFSQKQKLDQTSSNFIHSLTESSKELLEFKRFLLDRDLTDWNSRSPFENHSRKKMMMDTNTKKDVIIHLLKNSVAGLEEFMHIVRELEYEDKNTLSAIFKGNEYVVGEDLLDIEINFDGVIGDINIWYAQDYLKSSLSAVLYRVFLDDHKATTTKVGMFYSKHFGKSFLARNLSEKIVRVYKIEKDS